MAIVKPKDVFRFAPCPSGCCGSDTTPCTNWDWDTLSQDITIDFGDLNWRGFYCRDGVSCENLGGEYTLSPGEPIYRPAWRFEDTFCGSEAYKWEVYAYLSCEQQWNVIQQDHYVKFSAIVHLGVSIGTFNGGSSVVRYGGVLQEGWIDQLTLGTYALDLILHRHYHGTWMPPDAPCTNLPGLAPPPTIDLPLPVSA